MRQEELNIRDWVYCKSIGEKHAKITEIYETLQPPFKRMVSLNANGCRYCVPIEDIQPVQLTAEILVKNGFYDRNTQWYYKRYWSNGCFDIAVALNYREIEVSKVCGAGTDCEEVDYGSTIAFGNDIYVHELQHALRLCGLNDLADNFQV